MNIDSLFKRIRGAAPISVSTLLLLAVLGASLRVSAAPIDQSLMPPVVERTISINDPQLGPMVFDALAAGDPSAAEQGKLILLLHGFPACDEEFREILPALAAAGYYAVAPSQRGYSAGARPTNDSDYTLDHMVGDTLSMATALGADRFHLVGHDWGGGVAWYVAAVAPSRLSTLTVLSTPHLDAFAAAGANPLSAQKEMSSYAKVFALPGIANILLSGGPKFFALGLVAFGLPLERAEIYANALKDPVALNAALAWYRANPLPPPTNQPIGPVIVPTLYAWGNLDFAFGANAAYHTRQYVDAPYQFVVLRGVNHWVADYEPERVIQLVTTQVQGDSP